MPPPAPERYGGVCRVPARCAPKIQTCPELLYIQQYYNSEEPLGFLGQTLIKILRDLTIPNNGTIVSFEVIKDIFLQLKSRGRLRSFHGGHHVVTQRNKLWVVEEKDLHGIYGSVKAHFRYAWGVYLNDGNGPWAKMSQDEPRSEHT